MSTDNNNPLGSGSIDSPPEFPVPGRQLPHADDPHRAPSTAHSVSAPSTEQATAYPGAARSYGRQPGYGNAGIPLWESLWGPF